MTSAATTRDVAQRHADLCAISWMLSKTTAPLNSAQKVAMMNSPKKISMNSPKKISSSGPEVARRNVLPRGVITATHSVCLSHEGRSFAGLSAVNQRWATTWPCAPPRASGALLLAHHEHRAVGVLDNRLRNTAHQRPPYGAQTSATYHDRPCT